MQNVHRRVRCVARSAVLLKPHVVHVHIVQLGPKEIGYHRSVTHTVHGGGLTNIVFKKVRTNDPAGPKSYVLVLADRLPNRLPQIWPPNAG